jgi:hypothetical protein
MTDTRIIQAIAFAAARDIGHSDEDWPEQVTRQARKIGVQLTADELAETAALSKRALNAKVAQGLAIAYEATNFEAISANLGLVPSLDGRSWVRESPTLEGDQIRLHDGRTLPLWRTTV